MLRDLRVGDAVELQVYSGGQVRTIRLTTAKAEDVYGEQSGTFFFRGGDGAWGTVAPMPPIPPMAPTVIRVPSAAPAAPRVQVWRMGVI
jgi:hypothetical protein